MDAARAEAVCLNVSASISAVETVCKSESLRVYFCELLLTSMYECVCSLLWPRDAALAALSLAPVLSVYIKYVYMCAHTQGKHCGGRDTLKSACMRFVIRHVSGS